MLINGVNFPEDRIADFCRRHGVARLSLFGSILREPTPEGGYGFRPTSDVDVLVEFMPGARPTLLSLARMEGELSELIGRNVDLRTAGDLSYSIDQGLRARAQDLEGTVRTADGALRKLT